MKKTKKTTSSSKVQTPRVKRHSATKSKPVTIDLKAEEIDKSKPDAAADKTPAAKAPAAAEKKPDSKAETSKKAPAKASEPADSSFGRNAKKGSVPKTGKPDAPKPESNPKKQAGSKSGIALHFAAALVGGIVALGAGGWLQSAGILSTPNATDPAALDAAVQQRTGELHAQIKQLQAQLDAQGNGAAATVDTAALDARIEEILKGRAGTTGNGADIDEVINQVNETTVRVEKLLADQATTSQALDRLTSDVQSGAAGEGAAVSTLSLTVENLTDQSQKLRDDIRAIDARLTEMSAGTAEAQQGLNQEIADRFVALESSNASLADLPNQVQELRSALDTLGQSLASQQQSIAKLEEGMAQIGGPQEVAARAVAAAALKSDIDRGVPFAATLSVMQQFMPGNPSLEALSAYATKGVPTAAQLQQGFDALTAEILTASNPVPEDNLSARLVAGLKSFVTVKPRSRIDGTTPLAIASQISDSLKNGELGSAADLWNTLPQEGQAVSQLWKDQLMARIEADRLAAQSLQSALSSTATQ